MDSRPQTEQISCFLCTIGLLFTLVSAQACIKRDRDALLEFKSGLYDRDDQLRTWASTSNCCEDFQGVTCNSRGEVINVTFAVDWWLDYCDMEVECPVIVGNGTDLIGPTFSKLRALQTLDLRNFLFNASFPTGLSALENLSFLSLIPATSEGLSGHPTDIFEITTLKYLAIPFNRATGGLTDEICKLTKLEVLDISETVSTQLNFGASIGGNIPSCIGDLQQLRQLLLGYNKITGPVPDSIRRLRKLKKLELSGNLLTGEIPASLGELKALEVLHLQGNEFTGSIPHSLGNLANLKDLRLGGTLYNARLDFQDFEFMFSNLTGYIPASLGNLQNLQTLHIRRTKITGSIPSSLGNVKALTDLQIDCNALTGALPSSLGSTNLTIFQVNDNQISGGIPPEYGNLRNLMRFDAARNKLSGPIPKELSEMTFVPDEGVLDLSDNMLQGSIPEDLALALPPGTLNLSYNMLSGSPYPESLNGIREVYLDNNLLGNVGAADNLDSTLEIGAYMNWDHPPLEPLE